jgi:hypothetical protein
MVLVRIKLQKNIFSSLEFIVYSEE